MDDNALFCYSQQQSAAAKVIAVVVQISDIRNKPAKIHKKGVYIYETKFPAFIQSDPDWTCDFPQSNVLCTYGGTDITNDGCIGPKSTAFYELRGKGGAAAVTVSECMVHPETDGSHAYHLDTAILNSLASATYTADAISRHGAVPSLELSHSGMYAGTYMTDKSRQHSMHQWELVIQSVRTVYR